MNALSNSFLRSLLLFSFNQVFLLSGKFSYFTMFILNKTIKCEGMRRNSTPFLFWMTKQHSLISLSSSFQGQFIQKKSFLSQQPSEQWVLSFFKWQRVFLVIPLLSSGSTFTTPFSSSFFSLPLTFILFVLRIPSFLFNSFPSFPFLRLFQI